ncbi:MAG TPA: GNAT family N-acetyltransferase [Chthonomonadales bacterium]|nr:GNAT family N-acetyltransferase [Chthonomonadales bacterium]
MAEEVCLDGAWRFAPDPYRDGESCGWHATGVDDRGWREAWLPCSFEACAPELHGYEGPGWFRRSFALDEWTPGKRAALRFGGVGCRARVWVNGTLAGEHEGGFLPFELDIAALVLPGANTVAVCVDNTRRPGAVPGMKRGWRPFGGVLRSVALALREPAGLGRLRVTASHDGALRVDATASNDGQSAVRARMVVLVRDAEGAEVGRIAGGDGVLAPGERAELSASGRVDARPWSPEDPCLYTADAMLEGEPGTAQTVRFGFRSVRVDGCALLLNERQVRLFGFNRHEDSPATGMVPDPYQARRDLLRMKALGANWVRLCHYPHDATTLDLCDEVGLLAMAEIPLYWWDGQAEGEVAARSTLEEAETQLRAMIDRDANHPSVVVWSVGNETADERPEVADGIAHLVRAARALDPSRLSVHVSDRWPSAPRFDEDDLLCVNGYPSWMLRAEGRHASWTAGDAAGWWARELERLHTRFPDRPVLVTEYGHPALAGAPDGSLGERTQADAIAAEEVAMDRPWVCGRTIWCWADHPWPEEPFIRRMTTSPFGVVARDRRPKQAERMLRARTARAPDPPERDAQGWCARMVRRNLRGIPDCPLPAGYLFRRYLPGDGALWTDIQRDAEPYGPIDDDLFGEQFGDHLPSMPHRCVFVVDQKGAAVATATAWWRDDASGPDAGRVHWVAVRRAHQGRGIARPLVAQALHILSGLHDRAVLDTATERLAAIKVYLDLGFEPDEDAPEANQAWREVAGRLHHPALEAWR